MLASIFFMYICDRYMRGLVRVETLVRACIYGATPANESRLRLHQNFHSSRPLLDYGDIYTSTLILTI